MADRMVSGRLILSCGLLIGVALFDLPSVCVAQTIGQSNAASQVIVGDVLNIEGETYTIKDKSGHEVVLHVTKETKREDVIKVGDKIEAHVGSNGHATSIRVQLP